MVEGLSGPQNAGSTTREELVSQIRRISADAEHEAGEAVRKAALECCVHAMRQFGAALAALREPLRSEMVSATDGGMSDTLGFHAALAQTVAWESSIDEKWFQQTAEELWPDTAVSASHTANDRHTGVTNEALADQLLRAKVLNQEQAENPGSIGHPNLCPRACIYYAIGNCANGRDCGFCHMPHPKRPARLDKRHREALKKKPFSELVAMLLPLLKEKAAASQGGAVESEGAAVHQQQVGSTTCSIPDATDNDILADVSSLLDSLPDIAAAREGASQRSSAGSQVDTAQRGVSSEVHGGHGSSRRSGVSSAASNVSDDSMASGWKKDGLTGVLEVMSLRSLLTMLRRMSPPDAEGERAVMDQVFHKLHGHMTGESSVGVYSEDASSAAQSGPTRREYINL